MSDLIRREDAIEAFEKKCTLNCTDRNGIYTGKIRTAIMYEGVMEILNNIPSAEQEWKKGEWVDGLPYVNSHWWVCSVCHVPAPENHTGYNFCPSCGADMRGEQ